MINKAGWYYTNTGNSFYEIVMVGNSAAIYAVDPTNVYGVTDKGGTYLKDFMFLNGFNNLRMPAQMPTGRVKRWMFHIKNPSYLSDFFGIPDWYTGSILQSIDVNYEIDTWIQNFIDNNVRFDFLIITEGEELDPTMKTKLREGLTASQGAENKGRGGYLGVGYDTNVKVVELNKIDHSSLFAAKSEYIQQIVQAHGISQYSVAASNGGKSIAGNEAIGALRADYESYIKPTQEFYASKLNQMFQMMFNVNPQLTFKPMDVVSEKEKAVIADTFIKNKVASASYFRRKLFPDMTDEEIKDAEESTVDNTKVNFQEKPDAFDDTQSYERADRR